MLILEFILAYTISSPILRKTQSDLCLKTAKKSKKSLRIFIMFYFLPFTLAAIYFKSLKIIDYAIILSSYWLLLNENLLSSAILFGFLVYINPLYLDIVLVLILILANKQNLSTKKEKILYCAKFILCIVFSYGIFNLCEHFMQINFVFLN